MGLSKFAFMVLACVPAVAWAATPYSAEVQCPIGGAIFKVTRTASMGTYGQRLDGKAYTSWISPPPLAVCPNGFVVFKDPATFTPAEKERFASIIASETFRRRTTEESPYYRLYVLLDLDSIEREKSELWWYLLQASWEVDTDPVKHARYQREFLVAVDIALAALNPRMDTDDRWYAQLLAINAQRQLGNFEEAQARLKVLPVDTLPADSPIAERAKLLADLLKSKDASLEPDAALPRIVRMQRENTKASVGK